MYVFGTIVSDGRLSPVPDHAVCEHPPCGKFPIERFPGGEGALFMKDFSALIKTYPPSGRLLYRPSGGQRLTLLVQYVRQTISPIRHVSNQSGHHYLEFT